jgi:hypothetical protein
MIKIEMIFTDDLGNKIVANTSCEDSLTGKTLDGIEQLVYKAKSDLGAVAEHEILKLNQTTFSKKKATTIKKVRKI